MNYLIHGIISLTNLLFVKRLIETYITIVITETAIILNKPGLKVTYSEIITVTIIPAKDDASIKKIPLKRYLMLILDNILFEKTRSNSPDNT